MASASKDWTYDRIQQLRDLWADGDTTEQIGRKMGITKNAVVGKAHRLRLEARPSPIRRMGVRPQKIQRQGKKPSLPLVAVCATTSVMSPVAPSGVAPPTSADVVRISQSPDRDGFTRSRADCCWPIGEPGKRDFRFCGDVVEPNRPYCGQHCSVAYVRKAERHHGHGEPAHARA